MYRNKLTTPETEWFFKAILSLKTDFFHSKARAERAREINRQYETIHAISHVYSLTALIDLKANHYELLKYPPDLSNVAKDGTLDTRFCKEIIGYVDERFREGYRDFLNTETMTERLTEAEYAEYEYQNRNGDWLNDKLIVREKDKEGRVDSVILARSSINEQKKAELEYQAKLETAVRNEQTANQSKTDFLRRMSHDIRTPKSGTVTPDVAKAVKGSTASLSAPSSTSHSGSQRHRLRQNICLSWSMTF